MAGKTALLPLADGRVTIISSDDWQKCVAYSWYHHHGYARGMIEGRAIYLHRFILDAGPDQVCDHINGNRLDNRRENLRLVDKYVNARNRAARGKYLGVTIVDGRYTAKLIRNKKVVYLGQYADERVAAWAVDEARRILDGELHRPNITNFSPSHEDVERFRRFIDPRHAIRNALTLEQIALIRSSNVSAKMWATRLNVDIAAVIEARAETAE